MIQKKLMVQSLLLISLYIPNSSCIATGSSVIDDLNKEMQKAGLSSQITDFTDQPPALNKYTTSVQAFNNATDDLIKVAPDIKKISPLIGDTPINKLYLELLVTNNTLNRAFESLTLTSPKSHYEKNIEEMNQTLNGKQSTITGLEDELKTLKSNLTQKDQKIESFENSLKALIQMINPMIFNDSNTLTEEEKNQASLKSMQLISAHLKQNHPSFIPQSE